MSFSDVASSGNRNDSGGALSERLSLGVAARLSRYLQVLIQALAVLLFIPALVSLFRSIRARAESHGLKTSMLEKVDAGGEGREPAGA